MKQSALIELKNAGELTKSSLRLFAKHPSFIIPLLGCWFIYAFFTLYLNYFFPWELYSKYQILLIVFLVIFVYSFVLSFSCLIVLELIQQLERGQRLNPITAFIEALVMDIPKALPLTFIWAILWFVLAIIERLFSKDRETSKEFSLENAAKTLAGYTSFSLSQSFFRAFKKGVRMVVFLILPAIAWENKRPAMAIKKGLKVFRDRLSEFTFGLAFTDWITLLVFLPPALLFYVSEKFKIYFPPWVWFTTIVYCGWAWSFSLLLEQIFTAELYLWYLKWEYEYFTAESKGLPIPRFEEVSKPSLLDEIYDLGKISSRYCNDRNTVKTKSHDQRK